MKKFKYLFLALTLIFSTFIVGCSTNNNSSNDDNTIENSIIKSVDYDYIGYEQVSGEYSKVAFQIDVKNNTDEDTYVLKSNFKIKASAHTNNSGIRTAYGYNAETKVYLDSSYTQEATLSTKVLSNQTVTFYVVAPRISTELDGRIFYKDEVFSATIIYGTKTIGIISLNLI